MTNILTTDPVHFVKTYMELNTYYNGLVKFDLYPHQAVALDVINRTPNNMSFIQERQVGLSSLIAAYYVWRSIMVPGFQFGLTGSKLTHGHAAFDIVRNLYINLLRGPLKEKIPTIVRSTPDCFEIDNGSKAIVFSSWGLSYSLTHPSRGYRLSSVLIERADYIKDADLECLLQSCAASTSQIIATSNTFVPQLSSFDQHKSIAIPPDHIRTELTLDQLIANYEYAMKIVDRK